jgi:hypothetical protein
MSRWWRFASPHVVIGLPKEIRDSRSRAVDDDGLPRGVMLQCNWTGGRQMKMRWIASINWE